MKLTFPALLGLTAAAALAACATPDPYDRGGYDPRAHGAPEALPDPYNEFRGAPPPLVSRAPPGVSETRLAQDRYRIGYRGRGDAGRAADRVLLRAADLAVEQGYDWFVVEDRLGEAGREGGWGRWGGPVVSIGANTVRFGDRNSVGLGAAVGFGLGMLGQRPTAVSHMEVRFGRGAPPEGAYDARDIRRTIGPRLS